MLQYYYQNAGGFEIFRGLLVAGAGEVSCGGLGSGKGSARCPGAVPVCDCCIHARDRLSFALNASRPCRKGDVDSHQG